MPPSESAALDLLVARAQSALTVWVVDGDETRRRGMASALYPFDDVDLVGCFANAREVREALAAGANLDVALVDLALQNLPGTQAGEHLIEEITAQRPFAAVVALADRTDDSALFGALAAGASGYLHRQTSWHELHGAIRLAAMGGAPLSPDISRRVVQYFRAPPPTAVHLTRREREVLQILCTGASYRDAAGALGIAEGTVQTYVKALYEKLGVCSKAEAVRAAYELGLAERRRASGTYPVSDEGSGPRLVFKRLARR